MEHQITNGAICSFKCLKLKNGHQDCNTIKIDGYYVRCVSVSNVEYIELQLMEGEHNKTIRLTPITGTAIAKFPDPMDLKTGTDNKCKRLSKRIQLIQFPINYANARTTHKLQGKSLESVMVSTWSYTINWIYVVLSRVRTSTGLFVRMPLSYEKTRDPNTIKLREKTKEVLDFFRSTKSLN